MPTFLVFSLARSESVRFYVAARYIFDYDRRGLSASYLPLIARIRQALVRAHKKAYTISVGKLNPAKLANFAEIECFVLVACPENTLVDAKVIKNAQSRSKLTFWRMVGLF